MNRAIEEPFKTVIEKRNIYDPNIDYKPAANAVCDDHTWLKKRGYTLNMGGDCSYYVFKDGHCIGGLNATSYGDWGSYFDSFDKSDEAFGLLMDMYEEGIIDFWRIRVYINHQCYDYNHEKGTWTTYDDSRKWHECPSPLT